MEKNLVQCTRISVDCVKNDPVDVRCGGPNFLGFNFNVRKEEEDEIQNLILMSLESNEIPLLNIRKTEDKVDQNALWSSERIVKEIENEAEFLKEEENHVSGYSFFMLH